jgi:predicted transcriptional regulator
MNLFTVAKHPIGKYLKARRKKLGISQIDLAKRAHISPQFLGHVEAGLIGCPENLLKFLVRELKIQNLEIQKILSRAAITNIKKFLDEK